MKIERPSDEALAVAAACWTEIGHWQVQPEVELAFAAKVDYYRDLIESAWKIIADAREHAWTEDEEWRRAAIQWRRRYYQMRAEELNLLAGPTQ